MYKRQETETETNRQTDRDRETETGKQTDRERENTKLKSKHIRPLDMDHLYIKEAPIRGAGCLAVLTSQ